MRATLYYTVLRLGLFAVVLLLLYLAGARSLLLLGGAILISGVVSYFVLTAQRAAVAGSIGRGGGNFRGQLGHRPGGRGQESPPRPARPVGAPPRPPPRRHGPPRRLLAGPL